MQQVRRARADGVVMELIHARDSAKRELNASTVRLREMETNAGSDLTDLRGMTDTIAGEPLRETCLIKYATKFDKQISANKRC